jgi:CHAT domain
VTAPDRLAAALLREHAGPTLPVTPAPSPEVEVPPYREVEPADPPVGLGPVAVDPTAGEQTGRAILRVTSSRYDDETVFALEGSCCCAGLPYTAPRRHRRPPALDLAERVSARKKTGGETPGYTLHRIRNWSRTKTELMEWLSTLRRNHGEALDLIIWDDTDFAIPWELLWLPKAGASLPEDWLGCAMTVTRWTTIHAVDQSPIRDLSSATRCSGHVLGYVDTTQMRPDLELLDKLNARKKANVRELLDELSRPGDQIALVYIGCHGSFSTTSFAFMLNNEISLGEIDSRTFQRLVDCGALVFVNACHSARLVDDTEIDDDTLRGFAEVFLRSGAAGFIGATGAVWEMQSRRLASHLLDAIRKDPDTSVARSLRTFRRAHAVRDLPPVNDTAAARTLLPFIYTSMYVYFGSPATTIHLTRHEESR